MKPEDHVRERNRANFGIIAARSNCPPDWGTKEKCPKCRQFHLRPGYCQALNPEASAVIGSGKLISLEEAKRLARLPEPTLASVTPTVTEVVTVTATVTRHCPICDTPLPGKAQYCSVRCRKRSSRSKAGKEANDVTET